VAGLELATRVRVASPPSRSATGVGEHALAVRPDLGSPLWGEDPAFDGLVELFFVQPLRLGTGLDPDVEQLVLEVEAERRPLLRLLQVHVPAAEAAVRVAEEMEREPCVRPSEPKLTVSGLEDALVQLPVAEQIVAHGVGRRRREPQSG
jgi:hypothetical protein